MGLSLRRTARRGRSLALALVALLVPTFAVPSLAGAQPLPGLATGFTDPVFESPVSSLRDTWLERTAEEHGDIVRVNVSWGGERPPTEALAADPSWSGYDWSTTDAAISDAVARGLVVQITIGGAPPWAEGPGRPSSARGSWRPSPSAFGAFAHAAAARYSGAYTPPGATGPLPRVRYWQAWNEPNLSISLSPQWRRVGRRWAPESPTIYRELLDAFYSAVKSVQPDALVLSAGTAPYGDLPGGERMPPAQFDRNLFCLSESGLRARRCPDPAHFDILDHHPYSIAGPYFRAFNRDDVAIADMAKLIEPLRRAERLHTIAGAHHHQVWVTEMAWDSSPPNPRGVPVAEQARWLEQAFQLLWREGVSVVLWYQIVDQPADFTHGDEFQSGGIYLLDGAPKPSATAFRFPFVVNRLGRGRSRALAWGREPIPGALVTIEGRRGGAWRKLRTLEPGASGVFQVDLRVRRGALLRARDGGETSLDWRVR